MDFDPRSPEWGRLAKVLEERLAARRASLESPEMSERDTQVLRGRVAELKELLALPHVRAKTAQAKAELGALRIDE